MSYTLVSIIGLRSHKLLSRTVKLESLFAALPPEVVKQVHRDFARWSVELLRHQVKQAILTQKFPKKYEPLSGRWVRYKEKHGLQPGFWRATGQIRNELTCWQDTNTGTWHLGFPERVIHRLHKTMTVAALVRRLEEGDERTNLPPRPLFTPLSERYARGVITWFKVFIERHHPELAPMVKETVAKVKKGPPST